MAFCGTRREHGVTGCEGNIAVESYLNNGLSGYNFMHDKYQKFNPSIIQAIHDMEGRKKCEEGVKGTFAIL